MPASSALPVRHPVATFALVTLGLAAVGSAPSLVGAREGFAVVHPIAVLGWVLYAGSPALGASLVRRWRGDRTPTLARLRRALALPGARRWLAIAPAVACGLVLVAALAPGPPDAEPLRGRALLVLVGVSLLANVWEELGWRGSVHRTLRTRHGVLASALAVGVLAAAWHVPLLVHPASPMHGLPVVPWCAALLGGALVAGLLFERSGDRVLVSTTFHVALNVAGAALGIGSYGVMAVAMVAVAGLLAATTPGGSGSLGVGRRPGARASSS